MIGIKKRLFYLQSKRDQLKIGYIDLIFSKHFFIKLGAKTVLTLSIVIELYN